MPTDLPDDHQYMRYVGANRLRKRGEDDAVVGILGAALQLRPDEDTLSGIWVEFFVGSSAEQRDLAVRATRKAQRCGAQSAFAVAKVRSIKEICKQHEATVRVLHEEDDNNPAHAVIRRLPRDNADLLDHLAADAFVELIFNRDVA